MPDQPGGSGRSGPAGGREQYGFARAGGAHLSLELPTSPLGHRAKGTIDGRSDHFPLG
jgi:hypothetical protein